MVEKHSLGPDGREALIYYPVVVYRTEEEGGFFALVPDLPGCSAHGETPEEALHEARIAQELWLEGVRDRGWTVPEPSRYCALRAKGKPELQSGLVAP